MLGALLCAATGLIVGTSSPIRPRVAASPRAVAVPLTAESSQTKVLYDGQCMVRAHSLCRHRKYSHAIARAQVCLTNKALLTFFDWRQTKRLEFVDIRSDNYSPSKNGGVSFQDAMRHFHVLDGDHVAEGSEAVLLAYSKVGLGWLMGVLRFPLIRFFIDAAYAVVVRRRRSHLRKLSSAAPPGDGTALLLLLPCHHRRRRPRDPRCHPRSPCFSQPL